MVPPPPPIRHATVPTTTNLKPLGPLIESAEMLIKELPLEEIVSPLRFCTCLLGRERRCVQLNREYKDTYELLVVMVGEWFQRMVSPQWQTVVEALVCSGMCAEARGLASRTRITVESDSETWRKNCAIPSSSCTQTVTT